MRKIISLGLTVCCLAFSMSPRVEAIGIAGLLEHASESDCYMLYQENPDSEQGVVYDMTTYIPILKSKVFDEEMIDEFVGMCGMDGTDFLDGLKQSHPDVFVEIESDVMVNNRVDAIYMPEEGDGLKDLILEDLISVQMLRQFGPLAELGCRKMGEIEESEIEAALAEIDDDELALMIADDSAPMELDELGFDIDKEFISDLIYGVHDSCTTINKEVAENTLDLSTFNETSLIGRTIKEGLDEMGIDLDELMVDGKLDEDLVAAKFMEMMFMGGFEELEMLGDIGDLGEFGEFGLHDDEDLFDLNEDCVCTMDYNPVCGSDGVTYSNPCNAGCAGITEWELGACEGECIDYCGDGECDYDVCEGEYCPCGENHEICPSDCDANNEDVGVGVVEEAWSDVEDYIESLPETLQTRMQSIDGSKANEVLGEFFAEIEDDEYLSETAKLKLSQAKVTTIEALDNWVTLAGEVSEEKRSEHLGASLNLVADLVADYDYVGTAADSVAQLITEEGAEIMELISNDKSLAATDKIEELRQKIEGLKVQTKAAKYEWGIIPFADIDEEVWYFEAAKKLKGEGIMSGYGDGSFGAELNITRAELVKMIAVANGTIIEGEVELPFADVGEDHWSRPYLRWALDREVINEGETFSPDQAVTRAEAAKMMAVGFQENNEWVGIDLPADMSMEDWATPYVQSLKGAGVINGYEDGTFHPEWNINRAEAAKMIGLLIE